MRRPARLLLSVTLAAAPALAVVVPALSAPAAAAVAHIDSVRLNGFEAQLVADINDARRSAGLHALDVVPGATDVARRWSWRMAGEEKLWHNPSIVTDLEKAGSNAWTMISENVGYGGSDDPHSLFRAYMDSAPHRANILDPDARKLGVGVVERNGLAWNTLDFVNAYSTTYGRTRVPAAGLTMDRTRITSTTDVAIFEGLADQRFGARGKGGVAASRVAFTGPTAANDAAYTVLKTSGGGTGNGGVLMRDALDLSDASTLSLQLSAHDPRDKPVSVEVLVRRAFSDTVSLGHVTVGAHTRWLDLPLPTSARGFRNTVVLQVAGKDVSAAGGRVRLAMYDVRVTV